MTTTPHARQQLVLPQLSDQVFLADGGIETTLIYHHGLDLPDFAAFVLLEDRAGREHLRRYFRPYLDIAAEAGLGIVLETATWRANPDWARRLGYSDRALATANQAAVRLVEELRGDHGSPGDVVVSGCIGPRSDGYAPRSLMDAAEAERYHAAQVASFADSAADLVTAVTMTHTAEAIGIARAAAAAGMPSVVSFTVETDGRLPSGEELGAAVRTVDEATDGAPAYYMVNCAHPTHVDATLLAGSGWVERVRGLRANASALSHEELDNATTLDCGDVADFGARCAELHRALPQLTVLGGCCGTDARHIDAVRRAVAT